MLSRSRAGSARRAAAVSGPSNSPGGPDAADSLALGSTAPVGREPPVTLARLGFHRRHVAVRRIHHQRAALLAVDDDQLGAAGEPEVVVAADHAAAGALEELQVRLAGGGFAADRGRLAVGVERRVVLDLARRFVLLQRGGLFFRQREAFHAGRALDRSNRGDVVGALQIGMAVGRSLESREPRRDRGRRLRAGGLHGGLLSPGRPAAHPTGTSPRRRPQQNR